ncbi:MAG TPA: efflux RND transporter periplasmic adaptor subunit [Gemmatimonadales bacterium]|nr:efflux RND transporter periplasmic adaptor subunit [Gemmatimonadales bacterium]
MSIAAVTRERLAPPVVATGTLGPKEEITLSFKIGGVISRVLVDAGAMVSAGDTLAALDLREIDAAVTRAQSAADKAERDLARAKRLYGDSVVTLAQQQDAETGAQVTRADLEAARFNRRYAVIVAPAGGVILRRHAEPGELVAPGTPIIVLGSRARGDVVRVGLADRDVVRVRRGDRAVVRFDAVPDREFAGRVTEIAAAADPMTGTYRVEVHLPGATGLASGLVGQVEIRPAATQLVTLVPIEALLEADGSEGTVFALSGDGSRAERRSVSIAFLTGGRVALLGGLDGVQQVITEGAAYLEDGEAVRVRP